MDLIHGTIFNSADCDIVCLLQFVVGLIGFIFNYYISEHHIILNILYCKIMTLITKNIRLYTGISFEVLKQSIRKQRK